MVSTTTLNYMSKTDILSKQPDMPHIWQAIPTTGVDISHTAAGPLHLYFRKVLNEIWIATDRSQVENPKSESLTWSRWAFDGDFESVMLKPMLPDMQVTVRPEHAFRLAPGARVQIFTRIPVWVAVSLKASTEYKLMEIPTVELNKTWFGDFLSGSLCYWLSTSARREIVPEMFQPHTVITTMNIHNASREDLLIEKVNILVERLSVYIHENQLWSDEMDITYKGGDQHSEITMNGEPPSARSDAKHIANPRNPLKKSFAERILREIHLF